MLDCTLLYYLIEKHTVGMPCLKIDYFLTEITY